MRGASIVGMGNNEYGAGKEVHYDSDELFENNNNNVILQLPQSEDTQASKLIQKDIQEDLAKESIRQTVIPEDSAVELPNYTLDFTGVEQITQYQMRALEELLIDNYNDEEIANRVGNGASIDDRVPIYVWQNKDIMKLGYGDLLVVSKILPQIVQKVFAGQCKLYKDIIPGQPVKETKSMDLQALRMQL